MGLLRREKEHRRAEEDRGMSVPKIRVREWQGLYLALTGIRRMDNKSLLTCKVKEAWRIHRIDFQGPLAAVLITLEYLCVDGNLKIRLQAYCKWALAAELNERSVLPPSPDFPLRSPFLYLLFLYTSCSCFSYDDSRLFSPAAVRAAGITRHLWVWGWWLLSSFSLPASPKPYLPMSLWDLTCKL